MIDHLPYAENKVEQKMNVVCIGHKAMKYLFSSKKIIIKVGQYISAFNMGASCVDHSIKKWPELLASGHDVVRRN
jgi:hypothetical protein